MFIRKLHLFISLCLALFGCTDLSAQQAKITGSVTTADHKPAEAATVSLLKSKDSSLVKISLTDKTGAYEFERLKKGNYFLRVVFVGISPYSGPPIELAADTSTQSLATITLSGRAAELKSVTVTSRKPLIENKIDKTVVNVDASPTNTGLSVLEVLEKAPGVTVDNDGNVSLKGKQGVIILIDGKPTYLNAKDLANYLTNLPSSQLEQVEIMTQPSAKYDASGNSGLINLVTKKNKNNGFNGSLSTSAIVAKYFKNTNSLNFNWRHGITNVYGNYGYSYWEGFNDITNGKSLREDQSLPFSRYVEQSTFGRYSSRAHTFKAGIDIFANKKTSFGLGVNGNLNKESFTSSTRADIYDSLHRFVQYNNANSQNRSPLTNIGFNFNFQRKLDDKGKELSADADYVSYNTPGHQYTNNYLYNADNIPSENPYLLDGQLPSIIHIYTLRSDYKQPLSGNATLEAGVKASYVKTDNDAAYLLYDNTDKIWKPDSTVSNHFIYKENINAAYLNLQKKINKWSIQLGLRAEQTIADGNQIVKSNSFHKNYLQFFPTAYFSYQQSEHHTFGLSYGRRVERPDYSDLNPFQIQTDRYTYDQGNPNLQPQYSHNIELSYNYKGQLNVTANYTSTTDIINNVVITVKQPGDSNYTTYYTSQNIASQQNIGLSANYSRQLTRWWTINVFGNLFRNHFKGVIEGENIDVSSTSFNGNFSSQFNFNTGWSAELSGFYRAHGYQGSATYAQGSGMFSLGGGKQVLKGKGTIRLNLRDPLYLMDYKSTIGLNKGITRVRYVWDNRRAILSFTWRFGKSGNSSAQHKTSSDDEQSRVKSGGQQ